MEDKQALATRLVASIREKRDFAAEIEQGFFSLSDLPDPKLLKNAAASAVFLAEALAAHKKIVIVGDYDVDGVSATALVSRFFQKLGYSNFAWVIPSRFTHGYGLTANIRQQVLDTQPEVVLTVDNGTNSLEEQKFYQDQGLGIIITDHHLTTADQFFTPYIVNPQQTGCHYPFKQLCGVGVAFLFLIELRRCLRERGYFHAELKEPNLSEDLDYVALGTLADAMPLVGLNRLWVKLALAKINQSSGLKPYWTEIKQKYRQTQFTASDLSFKVIPLLNAAGRMFQAEDAVHLLLAKEQETNFHFLRLLSFNEQRKTLQATLYEQLKEQLKQSPDKQIKAAYVFSGKNFHEGCIGIVANQLSEKYQKPVAILTQAENGHWKGSCRAPVGSKLLAFLEQKAALFLNYGGHDQAAGMVLAADDLPEFIEFFENFTPSLTGRESNDPAAGYDFELEPADFCFEIYHALQSLEPFGVGNPAPVFLIRNLALHQPSLQREKVQKWSLGKAFELLLFKKMPAAFATDKFDVYGSLQKNTFQSTTSLNLICQRWRPHKAEKKLLEVDVASS